MPNGCAFLEVGENGALPSSLSSDALRDMGCGGWRKEVLFAFGVELLEELEDEKKGKDIGCCWLLWLPVGSIMSESRIVAGIPPTKTKGDNKGGEEDSIVGACLSFPSSLTSGRGTSPFCGGVDGGVAIPVATAGEVGGGGARVPGAT